jgi:ABC-type branched-subunit amino acid transport system substrate-binding protein
VTAFVFGAPLSHAVTGDEVLIGVNVPLSGPYSLQGVDQQRAYTLARDEINAKGGILGKKIRLIFMDSKSNAKLSTENAENLIAQGADMLTGGSSSGVAIAVGKVAQARGKLFLSTLTYSNATTGKDGQRHSFRETYNAWMACKALAKYLNANFPNKKYFYITADYTWGWSTRDSLMRFTGTENATDVLVPLGEAVGSTRYSDAVKRAMSEGAEVLVLVLFGRDMIAGLRATIEEGAKGRMQVVVPNFELHMALGGVPPYTEGAIGAVPWYWSIPYQDNYDQGKKFVEAFRAKYGKPPGSGGGTAYTNLMLYKWAVEKTNSFDAVKLIPALEGHTFTSLKDEETIRAWDHQTIQTVYVVRGKGETRNDKWDVFEVLDSFSGAGLVRTREENPVQLQPLPGETVPAPSPPETKSKETSG